MRKPAKPLIPNLNPEILINSYRIHLRAEGRRPKTIEHYLSASEQFITFAESEGFPPLQEIRREHIELWLESLFKRMRPASVLNRYLGLRRFYDWLADEHEIERNPFGPPNARRIKPPTVDRTEKDVVTHEDMRRVIATLEKARKWRDLTVICILFDTGMRASELANLRTEHVNIENGLVLLETTKARQPRVVRLSPKAIKYLNRYWRSGRKAPEYAVNGERGQLRRESVYVIVRRAFEAIGVKGTIGAHDLRHTSATHAARNMSERDLQLLYGWKDAEMARHYTQKALQELALQAHERFSPLERL